jgi:hypothetical protein
MGFISPNLAGMGSSAPPPAPPETAPKDQPQQTETIESLSARIKDKYPDYGAVDDRELVRRVIAKHPEYQTRLAGTELQRLTPGGAAPPAEQPGFLSQAADVVGNQVKGIAAESVKPWTALHEGYEGYERAREGGASIPRSLAFGGVKAANASGILDPIKDASEIPDRYNAYKGTLGKVGAGLYAGVAPTAAKATGVDLPGMEEAARTGNKTGVAAQAAVPAGEAVAAEATRIPAVQRVTSQIAGAVNPARDAAADAIARPTLSRPIAKVRTDRIYGHSPETAIVKENVSTAPQAVAKMQEVGQTLSDQLNRYPNVTIDNARIIRQTAQQFIDDATKHGKPEVANAVARARDAYLNQQQWGNLNRTPRATAEFKSNLYGEIKFRGGDDAATTADNFRRATASRLRDEINRATNDPKIVELNQRYGDLASARDTMQRQSDARTDKGITERVNTSLAERGTRGAAQLIGRQYEPLPNNAAVTAANATAARRGIPPTGTPTGPQLQPQPARTGTAAWNRTTNIAGQQATIPSQVTPRELPAQSSPMRGRPAPSSTGEIRDMPGRVRDRVIIPDKSGPLARNANQEYREPQPTFVKRGPREKPFEKAPEKPPQQAAKPAPKVQAQPAEAPKPKAQVSPIKPKVEPENPGTPQDLQKRIDTLRSQRNRTNDSTKYAALDKKYKAAMDEFYKNRKEPEEKEEAVAPAPKQSRTATFDSLPKDDQEWISNYAKEIGHMPQSLREQEMSDLQKYGEQGTLLKERIAMQHLERQKNGAEAEPGNERALGGASGEAARQERESSQQRRERQLRRIKPDRESPISYRDRPKTAREQTS